MKTEVLNLKNGAKLLYNRQKDVRGISINLSFLAGAFNDKKGKRGIAHFCEHALCSFPNAKMTREERASYKRKYMYFNAYTNNNRVVFEINVTEEDFEDAIDFVTESFSSINLCEEEFEKEKKIIEDEIKTRPKRNRNQLYYLGNTNIVKDKHYNSCSSSPAGAIETFSKITLDDLKEFIAEYFTLNNLTVVVTGNISKKRVKNSMHKYVETRIGTSQTQGFLAREVNDMYQPKFNFEKADEEGKAIFACLYKLKHIPWSYEVARDWKVCGILSPILHEYANQFYRQKKNLCYGCSLSTGGYVNNLISEFVIECQEENLQEAIDCYNEFITSLPKDISKEDFDKHKRRRLLAYNFDFLGLGQISDIAYDVYHNENKLYDDKYRKYIVEERKNISYEEVNSMYHTIFSTKPHISIISNDEKYKDFDYKNYVKKTQIKN